MARIKGSEKTGGRQLGSLNKRTADKIKFNRDLHARLKSHGCDIDKELARCIAENNHEMVKAIQSLYPYIQPKYKEVEILTIDADIVDDCGDDPETLLAVLA